MRSLPILLCMTLALGCAKGPSSTASKGPSSQFVEVNLTFDAPPDPARPSERPGRLVGTVGLIPAYKHKDSALLALWVFPRSSAPRLNKDCDLSDPSLQGHLAPILQQSFSAEGALLHFAAAWPGGAQDQVIALDVSRRGRHIDRIFGTMQGQ